MEKVRAYHAPYTFAYPTRSLSLQLVLPDEEVAVLPVFLDFSVRREGECRVGRVRLFPTDGFALGEHSVYTATLTPAQLAGGEALEYRFLIGDAQSEEYSTPLLEEPFSAVELEAPAQLAILPLAPQKRIYHADGDAEFAFEVAGESIEQATVFIKIGGAFSPHPATWSKNGYFSAVLPREQVLLARGRVEYYIEVGDGVFSVSLGSAERPMTIRAVDNKGPEILASVPACAKTVEALDEIRISYFDVSGIDAHASIFCVDGINVSEDAIWKKTELLYPITTPLGGGKHTIELSLRDTLGNRTYFKSDFEISGETVSKNRRRGPLKGAKFVKELVSLVKDVFSPKE